MIGKSLKITSAEWQKERSAIVFSYDLITDEKTFNLEEKLTFPYAISDCSEAEAIKRGLHIALAISYYKTFMPPEIEHPYEMSEIEATFWNIVYKNGLGEFLYINKLSVDLLAKFHEQNGKKLSGVEPLYFDGSAILGIGGGKDSIVAGELLSEISLPFNGFVMATGEQLGQTKSVTRVMDTDLLVVNREIDKQIVEMNKLDGAYNGHIPISLIFALVGSMLAVGKGSKYVVVANESSASIPHVKYEEVDVNHQWSKSIEFERLFQDYLHSYVSPELRYFSAIRPLSSVAVAKRFARYPDYFEVFTSDNGLFKIDQEHRDHPRWSKNSSKSLSSFILLAPWLPEDDLMRTFGRDFLNDTELENMLKNLLGFGDEPVLDCVGTAEELKSSLKEVIKQNKFKDSYLVKLALEQNLIDDAEPIDNFLILDEDAFPEEISNNIKRALYEG